MVLVCFLEIGRKSVVNFYCGGSWALFNLVFLWSVKVTGYL